MKHTYVWIICIEPTAPYAPGVSGPENYVMSDIAYETPSAALAEAREYSLTMRSAGAIMILSWSWGRGVTVVGSVVGSVVKASVGLPTTIDREQVARHAAEVIIGGLSSEEYRVYGYPR